MSYTTAVKNYEEKTGRALEVRTDYRCKAHGCPNAGSMEGDVCYWHMTEPDPSAWAAVTHRIRSNFDAMRNWGRFPPELQARHRAAAQQRHAAK